MGYRSIRLGTKRVELRDGFYVVLRPLNKADADECNAALFGTNTFEGQLTNLDDIKAQLNHSAYSDMQLTKAIIEWNIDFEDDGVISPITLENVRQLNQEDSNAIVLEIRNMTGLGQARNS